VLDMPEGPGYIVGRNRLARAASNELVLFLDDDAYLLEGTAIGVGVELMARDTLVAAVAFAQAEASGEPWPVSMQPAPVSRTCLVPAYIGCAHLLRRSRFLALGAYDESFVFYGEEKDWCLRAMDAGQRVVYVPSARVAHVPDLSGRDPVRYLRQVTRNDCLFALRREPLPLPVVSVPIRLYRYVKMRRHGAVHDPGGLRWLVGEVLSALASTRLSGRVRWATMRRWRRIRRTYPTYPTESAA
jgi:glycosyltransferase involved in cell wall biosynthesis